MWERFRERFEHQRSPERQFRRAAQQLNLACARQYRQVHPEQYVVNRLRIPESETGLLLLQKEIFGWSISVRGGVQLNQTLSLAEADVELRSAKDYPNRYVTGRAVFAPTSPEQTEAFLLNYEGIMINGKPELEVWINDADSDPVRLMTALVRSARREV